MTEQQAEMLQRVATDVAVIKDRVSDFKEWKDTHPRVCPLHEHIEATENTPKQGRANAWIVFGVVVAAITGTVGIAIGILK